MDVQGGKDKRMTGSWPTAPAEAADFWGSMYQGIEEVGGFGSF